MPERIRIGGTLVIPRMINGLWQLAGGHDEKVDIAVAAEAMSSLYEPFVRIAELGNDNTPRP